MYPAFIRRSDILENDIVFTLDPGGSVEVLAGAYQRVSPSVRDIADRKLPALVPAVIIL